MLSPKPQRSMWRRMNGWRAHHFSKLKMFSINMLYKFELISADCILNAISGKQAEFDFALQIFLFLIKISEKMLIFKKFLVRCFKSAYGLSLWLVGKNIFMGCGVGFL